MIWFAIRTEPGAQMPKREYVVEDAPRSKKGYRIVPSLNANLSAVERSLANAGIAHYMPVQRKVIRDRRNAHTYTTRRFALIPGYVFVSDVRDFGALEAIPGVLDVIRNQGTPYPIPPADIDRVREWEGEAEQRCLAHLWKLEQDAKRPTRRTLKERFPRGSSVTVVSGYAQGRTGRVIGPDRNGKVRAFIEGLQAMSTVSIAPDMLEVVDTPSAA